MNIETIERDRSGYYYLQFLSPQEKTLYMKSFLAYQHTSLGNKDGALAVYLKHLEQNHTSMASFINAFRWSSAYWPPTVCEEAGQYWSQIYNRRHGPVYDNEEVEVELDL